MKIGKYEFVDEAQANSKIEALSDNYEAVVKLGYMIINGQPSEKYHVDVIWNVEDHPYGWKSYAVANVDENGIHAFYGVDYQNYKI